MSQSCCSCSTSPLADTLLVAERLNVARINIAVAQNARQDLERQPSKLVDLCVALASLLGCPQDPQLLLLLLPPVHTGTPVLGQQGPTVHGVSTLGESNTVSYTHLTLPTKA